MAAATDRMQYIASKIQHGAASPGERDELARLVGHDPREFEGPDGAWLLLAIALAAIAAAVIVAALLANRE